MRSAAASPTCGRASATLSIFTATTGPLGGAPMPVNGFTGLGFGFGLAGAGVGVGLLVVGVGVAIVTGALDPEHAAASAVTAAATASPARPRLICTTGAYGRFARSARRLAARGGRISTRTACIRGRGTGRGGGRS